VISDASKLSDKVVFETTCGGGHVAFMTRDNPSEPKYWLEERVIVY